MDQKDPPVAVTYDAQVAVATLARERILEDADLRTLEQTLLPLVAQTDAIRLVIDFSNVRFLTSAALGLLIRIAKKIREQNGRLALCSIQPKILEVFKITQLDRVFQIYPDTHAAVNALAT